MLVVLARNPLAWNERGGFRDQPSMAHADASSSSTSWMRLSVGSDCSCCWPLAASSIGNNSGGSVAFNLCSLKGPMRDDEDVNRCSLHASSDFTQDSTDPTLPPPRVLVSGKANVRKDR